MKKIILVGIIILVSFLTIYSGISHHSNDVIKTCYDVYLKGDIIGTIKSEDELLAYIDKQQEKIKQYYKVSQVNVPNDLQIQKTMQYSSEIVDVSDIYKKISESANFTIEGYQVHIVNDAGESNVYITDYDLFESAIKNVIQMYVGKDKYEKYINNEQQKIEDVGTYINNIYLNDKISIKHMNIPISEKIYSSVEELSQFLLYGTNEQQKKYITSVGDTIDSISFKNQISVEEFMISNPQFTSSNLLLYPGQEVTIGVTDPQIQVVVEQQVVEDQTYQYKTIETVDENRVIGTQEIVQKGENGILRVASNEKYINGANSYVEPISKEVLKPSVDKIVIIGGKKVSGVGSLTDWAWPTDSGWTITSGFIYRINPISYERELHGALDIAGTGYGSPVYAANNGVIVGKSSNEMSGNYIYINHNNGYATEYCHLSGYANISVGQTVEKGQIIGYIGMTGWATGPHLHFAVWKNSSRPWGGGYRINPFELYK